MRKILSCIFFLAMTLKVIYKKTDETEDVPGTTKTRKIQASLNKNRNSFQDQIYSREKKGNSSTCWVFTQEIPAINIPRLLNNLSSSHELHMDTSSTRRLQF